MVRRATYTFGYHLSSVRRIDVERLVCRCWDKLVMSISREQRTALAMDPALPCCRLAVEL